MEAPADFEEEPDDVGDEGPPPPPDVVAMADGCVECGILGFHEAYYRAFGVRVCNSCKRTHDKYSLVSKTRAKEELLITDADLDGLRFLTKKNPRHETWGDMKLYRRSEVERVSRERHGDDADMEEKRQARDVAKLERRIAKAKRKRERENPGTRRVDPKQRRRVEMRLRRARHTHEFGKPEALNDEKTRWRESCTTCDFVNEYSTL